MNTNPECRHACNALWRGMKKTLIIAAAAWLAACGGGGTDTGTPTPAPTPPPPVVLTGPLGDPVTQTVGAAGGTVEATTLGVKVRVSFPAGALARDTAVRITPQTPAAGDWVALKLEPAGVFFAKPVTLVLELPAAVVPGAAASLRQRFSGADNYAATTVDASARTLTTRFLTFGGAALDVLARPAGVRSGRALALNVKAQADPGVPADSLISAQPNTPLADLIASIRRQVTILENVGDFEAAFALQANIASLLNRRDDVDYAVTATPFLREAHDTACLALSAAVADAKAARPATVAEFKPVREKLGNWWVITEQTDIEGVGCPVNLADFDAAALDLTRRELDLQDIELRKIKPAPDREKQRKLEEAAAAAKIARRFKLEVEILYDAAANLDLPPLPPQGPQGGDDRAHATGVRPLAVRNSGYATIIQTELLDPLVAPAREAAWSMTTTTSSLAQYPVLIDAFGGAPPLQQDVQYLRTRISVTSTDSQGSAIASATLGFDSVPELPADPVKDATLRVKPGGRLALSGNVATLECAAQGSETLTVSFENVQVASVSGSGGALLAGALANLDPAGLLQAAGLPADDTGTHPLRIRRSTPCAGALGLGDEVLATVALDFGAGPLQVKVTGAELRHVSADSRALELREPQYNLTRSAPVPVLPAPVPFSMSTNDCCAPHSAAMSLRLRDPNTVDFSDEFSNLQFPNGVYVLQRDGVDFRVTFARSGTVTMRPNPAWFVNGSECYYRASTNELRVNSNMHFVIGAAGEINASNYDAGSNSYLPDPSKTFAYSPCDADSKALWFDKLWTRSSAEFQVLAGSEWQFRVSVTHEGQGVMVGGGTAMTIHFEPRP